VSRSHPPTLITLAKRTIVDEGLIERGERVLAACSGGPDSTALLHVLALLRKPLRFDVHAHGVDHGLRPEAQAELDLARRVATELGVPFGVTRVDVASGANLQARARAARYEALEEAARLAGARTIATGHTADDRAETFLLRLLRGAGPRGLAVLPARAPRSASADRIRPLIGARRTDVLAHLSRHELPFARDPSNENPRFSRVRVRSEVLPLLEQLSPGIVAHLCTLAEILGEVSIDADEHASLGREQRRAIERARRLGRAGVRLLARGGEQIEVTFSSTEPPVPEQTHRAPGSLGPSGASRTVGRSK
jgi:tRNA(Ile)-lysidine synthase